MEKKKKRRRRREKKTAAAGLWRRSSVLRTHGLLKKATSSTATGNGRNDLKDR